MKTKKMMKNKLLTKNKSFNVQIWCGLKQQYSKKSFTLSEVKQICIDFVNTKKECVTVTKTKFFYVNGEEKGFVVGFINYPRFPKKKKEILKRALELATLLMEKLNQNRVTITTPKHSLMLTNKLLITNKKSKK